jgi:hypothetical protein
MSWSLAIDLHYHINTQPDYTRQHSMLYIIDGLPEPNRANSRLMLVSPLGANHRDNCSKKSQ